MPLVDADARRAYMRDWYARNRKRERARQTAWAQANSEKVKGWSRRKLLQREYGLTVEQYETMFESQGGLCLICGQPETSKSGRGLAKVRSLAVDHNHKTGQVRGLLCIRCNRAMGFFRDDPNLLMRAAQYVQERDS